MVKKKETFQIGEKVKLQDIKSKLWNLDRVVTGIHITQDGTIVSYDRDADDHVTTCHRIYANKVRNSNEVTESDLEDTGMGGQSDSH